MMSTFQNVASITENATLPSVPKNTKFIDLPSHIKEALLKLELKIKEQGHKAVSVSFRPFELDQPKLSLTQEIARLNDKLNYYDSLMEKSKRQYEACRNEEENTFINTELGIKVMERLKSVELRNGIASADHSMTKYFTKVLEDLQKEYLKLKARMSELESYIMTYHEHPSSKLSPSVELTTGFQNLYQMILKVAGKLVQLENEIQSLQ